MRVGIDCRSIVSLPYGEKGGVEYYTYSLIKRLFEIDKENEYVLFFDHGVKDTTRFERSNVAIRHFPFSEYRQYLPFTYSHMLMAGFLNRERLDVFHSPAHIIPMLYAGKSIITIRNLALFRHPEWFTRDSLFALPSEFLSRTMFSLKFLLPQSVKKAHRVITFAKDTKRDIVKLFGIPSKRVTVIYPGIDEYIPLRPPIAEADREEIASQYEIDAPYFFYVGTLEPRKNVSALIDAYRELLIDHPEHARFCLVIAGEKGGGAEETLDMIEECNADLERRGYHEWFGEKGEHASSHPIRYVGYVSYQDKMLLLRNASCFVYPSLYEGFCSSVVKAMSYGIPVVTSNLSALKEIGGEALVYIDPNDGDEIKRTLHMILTKHEFVSRLKERAVALSKKFEWRRAAQETLDLYKEVCREG